jgi:hypothetical protein
MLQFVVVAVTGCPGTDCYTSPALFVGDDSHQVTLTRDAAGAVTAYVDRAPQFTFDDTGTVAVFDQPDAVAMFAIDDTSTTEEASAGTIRRIRIYDAAIAANEIEP